MSALRGTLLLSGLVAAAAACGRDPGARPSTTDAAPRSAQPGAWADPDGAVPPPSNDEATATAPAGKAPAAAPAALERHCIPPGREELIMKGFAVAGPGAGGCRLDQASVQHQHIELRYVCGETVSRVLAQHPDGDGSDVLLRTAKFALRPIGATRPPAGLLSRLAGQIREMETQWQWIDNCVVRTSSHEVGLDFYRSRQYKKAFEYFVDVARKTPTAPGALRMISASLEPQPLSLEDVLALAESADSAPQEPLPQFIAGVAAYAFARYRAADRGQRKEAYQRAVRYLDRTRVSYPFEPLVLTYLAVSQFRLGNQAEAEALIDQAARIGPTDPDPCFYGAEILQRTNTRRTIAHVDAFLLRTPEQLLEAPAGPRKRACVRAARDRLLELAQAKTESPGRWDLLAGGSSASGDVLIDCETFEQTISIENGLFDEWMDTESAARDREPMTRHILDLVAPAAGMKIADVGGGAGYYTFKLAKTVGPNGKVIATDLELRFVEHMRSYARTHQINNVEVIHVQDSHFTKLSPDELDVILMVDSVDVGQPASPDERARVLEYLQRLSRQLKKGGRVVYHRGGINNPQRGAVVAAARDLFLQSGGYSTIIEAPLPQPNHVQSVDGGSSDFTIVATR